MEWYGPLTILPAVGLLVLSTSGFIIALSEEISKLSSEKEKYMEIIMLKLKQLKRLGIANGFLYGSALLFLMAGILKVLTHANWIFNYLLIAGVIFIATAILFLLIHAVKSVSIRSKHLKL